jgi:poly-gamma-glutamate capsule biosynthesis protein CapA/YwtB (metallophosphatase superfamily)
MLKRSKHIDILLATLVFVMSLAGLLFIANATSSETYVKIEEIKVSKKAPQKVHLSFVGDIMLDRSIRNKVNKLWGGDYHKVFENADFLKEPDLMFANLEGPVSNRGANVGSIYSFRFDPVVFSVLKDVGFDVLSMANNHIGDWGRLALEDTITLGKEQGFKMVGGGIGYEEASKPDIHEVKGLKVGYVGFSDFGPPSVLLSGETGEMGILADSSGVLKAGVLSASDPNLPTIISDAKKQVDLLVVSFHFGDEYQPLSNARQQRLAHTSIDAGADIVVGHHPHVEQETEEYNGGLIAYSLGNFVFDQYFSEETMRGLKLDVMVTKEGIESYSTSTIQLNSNYQPSMLD